MKCPLKNFEECIGKECGIWSVRSFTTKGATTKELTKVDLSRCSIPAIADRLLNLK